MRVDEPESSMGIRKRGRKAQGQDKERRGANRLGERSNWFNDLLVVQGTTRYFFYDGGEIWEIHLLFQ